MIAELGGPEQRAGVAEAATPGTPRNGDDDWQRDDVNRRELLRLMTVTGSLLAVPGFDADRVTHAVENPRYLDHGAVDDFARINEALWASFSRSQAKRDVLPEVRKHLATLNDSLSEPQTDDVKQRLSGLFGDVFQLCGEVFFDGNHYADASSCYSTAVQASREAKNLDMWACAMTRHAFISIYEQEYRHALPLLNGAAQLARRGDPERTTRYWVAAVQAQTFAGIGDLAACERALDTAEQVAHIGDPQPCGWLRFEGSRLDEERGSCYVTLGEPERAEPVLQKALTKGISTRRRGSVLTDLAIASVQRGDLDQALMHGAAALDTVRQTASAGYVGRKLTDLRRRFAPHMTDRHVRYLDTKINDMVAAQSAPA